MFPQVALSKPIGCYTKPLGRAIHCYECETFPQPWAVSRSVE